MPALAKPFETYEKPGLIIGYAVTNAAIYKGALLGLNSDGHAVAMAHGTANLKFIGVATESADNSAGEAGAKKLNAAKSGSFVFKAAAGFTPTLANLGAEVYANTDWEVQVSTSGLTNNYKIGRIVGLETTSTGVAGVRVRIHNHVS